MAFHGRTSQMLVVLAVGAEPSFVCGVIGVSPSGFIVRFTVYNLYTIYIYIQYIYNCILLQW